MLFSHNKLHNVHCIFIANDVGSEVGGRVGGAWLIHIRI